MGREGGESLLCDPGSKLRLGGRRKKKGEDNKWDGKEENVSHTACRDGHAPPANEYNRPGTASPAAMTLKTWTIKAHRPALYRCYPRKP